MRRQSYDMRGAWPLRDVVLERQRVRPETVERWEKVGFGVQRGTRAAHAFYRSPAFTALVEILEADPNEEDMAEAMSNRTLQPGDTVVRPSDEEGYPPTFGDSATHTERYLVLPDGFGGTFLKEERDVTDADYEIIKNYLEEEAAFLAVELAAARDVIVRHETANMDEEIRRLLEE
jgi:hypothetical protein